MWVAITLAATTFLVFLGCCALVLIQQIANQQQVTDLMHAHKDVVRELTEAHTAEVRKLVDGPSAPEIILPEQSSKVADEEWLVSPESIIEHGDDLSPVFDADEV